MFLDVVSNLSEQQKVVVQDLGFSGLLELCCPRLPMNLLLWLVDHFNAATRTLMLPNGFKFELNPKCVHKILGIPNGGLHILRFGTLESYKIIKDQIYSRGVTPTVSELCNQISPDLSDFEFGRLFMLLALSSFLCPNTRGACSTRYYHAVLNISSVPKYDWCSFVLDWLVSYLVKFKVHKRTTGSNVIGGCCHILVVIMAILF